MELKIGETYLVEVCEYDKPYYVIKILDIFNGINGDCIEYEYYDKCVYDETSELECIDVDYCYEDYKTWKFLNIKDKGDDSKWFSPTN